MTIPWKVLKKIKPMKLSTKIRWKYWDWTDELFRRSICALMKVYNKWQGADRCHDFCEDCPNCVLWRAIDSLEFNVNEEWLNTNQGDSFDRGGAVAVGLIQMAEAINKRPISITDSITDIAQDKYNRIMRNREKYLEAWVAETGMLPSEAVLVESFHRDTVVVHAEIANRLVEAAKNFKHMNEDAANLLSDGPEVSGGEEFMQGYFSSEEDPGYCPYCGERWQFVRPGKSQPNCSCQDD